MTLEYELYIKDRFLRILSSGANLTELCNFLASCISAPVAITLTSKTIIAKSQDYTGNLVDEYVNSMNLCEMEELQRVQEEIDAALASQQPETRTWPYSRHKRIICGCFWHGRMLAVIDCPIIGKNLSADAEALVALAAPIFMTALRLNSYIDINTVDPIQTFITGLLRGEIDQKNQMISPIYSSVKNWRALFITVNPGEKTGPIYSAVDAYCLRSGRSGRWNSTGTSSSSSMPAIRPTRGPSLLYAGIPAASWLPTPSPASSIFPPISTMPETSSA